MTNEHSSRPAEATTSERRRLQVQNATGDLIFDALDADRERIEQSMPADTDQALARKRGKLIQLEAARGLLPAWARHNDDLKDKGKPPVNFPDYVRALADADDASESVLDADAWASERYVVAVTDALRAREQAELEEAASQTSAATPVEWPKRPEPGRQTSVDSARQTVERVTARAEIFDTVLREYAGGKTLLYTDFNGGYKSIGDGSRRDGADVSTDIHIDDGNRHRRFLDDSDEYVLFTDVLEQDTEVTNEDSREYYKVGPFTRSRTVKRPVTRAKPGSERPAQMTNAQGETEDVVRFRYRFQYSINTMARSDVPHYPEHRGARAGQQILASLDLPKSVAQELKAQIEADPASVRDLVEQLFLHHNNGTLTEPDWRTGAETTNPIRPPYERLPSDWQIQVASGQEMKQYGRNTLISK